MSHRATSISGVLCRMECKSRPLVSGEGGGVRIRQTWPPLTRVKLRSGHFLFMSTMENKNGDKLQARAQNEVARQIQRFDTNIYAVLRVYMSACLPVCLYSCLCLSIYLPLSLSLVSSPSLPSPLFLCLCKSLCLSVSLSLGPVTVKNPDVQNSPNYFHQQISMNTLES